jgi:hypothetical protein
MTNLLGWSLIPQTVVRRERWSGRYKTRSVPLVQLGQNVQPDQPAIRFERLKTHVEVEATLPIPHLSLPGVAPGTGSAHEFLPAGLRGLVVDVTRRGGVIIESHAAVLQGAIGAGEQVAGILTMWRATAATGEPQAIPAGALLVVPGPLNLTMLHQAMASGVVGVIASSISSRDLEGFLRTDLIELIGSIDVEIAQVHLPPLTILCTEGLGIMAMPTRTLDLLSRNQGSIALLSGATSVWRGIFPELIISLPENSLQHNWQAVQPDPTILLGAQVRICSGEYEGASGTVTYLFAHQQAFLSGVHARAVHLQLEDGSTVTVPITSVERMS